MLDVAGTINPSSSGGADEHCRAGAQPAIPPVYPPTEPPILSVLIVESDPVQSRRVEHALRHMTRYEPRITIAGNAAAAQFALSADEFDAILISSTMRDHRTGTDIVETLGEVLDARALLFLGAAEGGQSASSRRFPAAVRIETSRLTGKMMQSTLLAAVSEFSDRIKQSTAVR